MAVFHVHQRTLPTGTAETGALIDGLSGPDDRLWPHDRWPAMRLEPGLAVGACGHGPVRYEVAAYVPGHRVRFTFSGPRGFHGFHEFTVHPAGTAGTVLRHSVAMTTRGSAMLTWPLVYRPFHNAVIEDSLDRAERACTGTVAQPARWSAYVRLLRRLATMASWCKKSPHKPQAGRRTERTPRSERV